MFRERVMLPSHNEHRKKERKNLDCDISVKDIVLNKIIGQMVNLSEDGFMVIGDDLVRENCLYQLQFLLSGSPEGISELNVGAECLWRNESGSGTQFWSGFHIIDISDEDKHRISQLVNK